MDEFQIQCLSNVVLVATFIPAFIWNSNERAEGHHHTIGSTGSLEMKIQMLGSLTR